MRSALFSWSIHIASIQKFLRLSDLDVRTVQRNSHRPCRTWNGLPSTSTKYKGFGSPQVYERQVYDGTGVHMSKASSSRFPDSEREVPKWAIRHWTAPSLESWEETWRRRIEGALRSSGLCLKCVRSAVPAKRQHNGCSSSRLDMFRWSWTRLRKTGVLNQLLETSDRAS